SPWSGGPARRGFAAWTTRVYFLGHAHRRSARPGDPSRVVERSSESVFFGRIARRDPHDLLHFDFSHLRWPIAGPPRRLSRPPGAEAPKAPRAQPRAPIGPLIKVI